MRCQIVVIGSGPGGAITACTLAEAGRDVLLIEEGPNYAVDSHPEFTPQEMAAKYRNGGLTVAMGRVKLAYVEGRCVGGGSEVNAGFHHRTPKGILEKWQKEFAVEGLSETEMIPHFEACEKDLSLSFYPAEKIPRASLKLDEGAKKLGWKSLEIPRWVQYGADSQRRQSMSQTYIPRAVRAGCRLVSETRVEALIARGSGWLVSARRKDGSVLEIEADTVFVSCGTIHTPTLLRRSGIKRNIGDSLSMHPTVKAVAQFNEGINSASMGIPIHQIKEFAPRLSFGGSVSSPPYLALGMNEHPTFAGEVNRSWRNMANYYGMIAPTGFGTVRPLPGFKDPLVRFQLSNQDLKNLGEALKKLCLLLFEAGAIAIYPGLSGGTRLRKASEIAGLPDSLPPARSNVVSIHLFSSCPMGENRAICATDSFGRVHGYENLYIADASLLCSAPGVNPQGSVMGIVRRNALKFLGAL